MLSAIYSHSTDYSSYFAIFYRLLVNNLLLNSELIQKLLEIEKEIVREVALGDKPHLRKSTDPKAQISPLN